MRYSRCAAMLGLFFLVGSAVFATAVTGVFQGVVVQLPRPEPNSKVRWMYVQGKNGAIRRANIAKAAIEYDEDYPAAKRHKRAAESLRQAVEVRVTAEQDEVNGGEWQATHVLILAPRGPKSRVAGRAVTVALK